MKHCRTPYKIILLNEVRIPVFKHIMWVSNLLNCVVDKLKGTELLSFHVMLCYVMLCYVMLCYVMLCYHSTPSFRLRNDLSCQSSTFTTVSSNVRADLWCTDITKVPFPKYQLGGTDGPPLSQQKVYDRGLEGLKAMMFMLCENSRCPDHEST
jgi:hypothetical protein